MVCLSRSLRTGESRGATCTHGAGQFVERQTSGRGLLEQRIDFGPGYRIYFGRDDETLVILLTGGAKKRQQRDIEQAKSMWSDYRRRKRGAI
jgi:putative addiction module killer protein